MGNCSPRKVAQPGPREEETPHPSFHSTRQPSSPLPLSLLSEQIPVVVIPLPLQALVKHHHILQESLPHSWEGAEAPPCCLGWVKMTSSCVLGVSTEHSLCEEHCVQCFPTYLLESSEQPHNVSIITFPALWQKRGGFPEVN